MESEEVRYKWLLKGMEVSIYQKPGERAWILTCADLHIKDLKLKSLHNITAMEEALKIIKERANFFMEHWAGVDKEITYIINDASCPKVKELTPTLFDEIEVSIKREKTISIAEHEVLLSFNRDQDAEAFTFWWSTKGKADLSQWCLENNDQDEEE
jgi:hypothetical protein